MSSLLTFQYCARYFPVADGAIRAMAQSSHIGPAVDSKFLIIFEVSSILQYDTLEPIAVRTTCFVGTDKAESSLPTGREIELHSLGRPSSTSYTVSPSALMAAAVNPSSESAGNGDLM